MSFLDCIPSFSKLFGELPSTSSPRLAAFPTEVDLLCLGSGWTGSFVLPQAAQAGLRCISTTRAGGSDTIPWTFDPQSDDSESFRILPDAKTVLIVFPLYDAKAVERLVRGYLSSRVDRAAQQQQTVDEKPRAKSIEDIQVEFILLGSTGAYNDGPTFTTDTLGELTDSKQKRHPHHHDHKHKPKPVPSPWLDNTSEVKPVPRALAENELLSYSRPSNRIRSTPINTTVLMLCGLWGHGRSVRNYMSRLPDHKDAYRSLGSVHLIHGRDVGRAIIATQGDMVKAAGKRWILTNGRIYDLWDLAAQFGSAGDAGRDHPPQGPAPKIVRELLSEPGSAAKALPRSAEAMFEMTGGRSKALDGREFWDTFGIEPEVGWVF